MSRQAQIEEVSDSDPEETDPSDFDPSDFGNSIIAPAAVPSSAATAERLRSEPQLQPQMQAQRSAQADADRERSQHWQCLYPIYFDSGRSRAEGRRVGKEQAVPNPLAREIVDAVAQLGLNVVFEPGKTHPKDWSNPGRVRVHIKQDGKSVARNVKNKHHLYSLVSDYLRQHPTTPETPMRLQIRGLPAPTKPNDPPPMPRGWKMNTILPLHSPALTGGGVSENMFKDFMSEMTGQTPADSAAESSGKVKKPKRKVIRA